MKLTLHEIKVLEINATSINANLLENEFRINKINAKEEVEFHNKGIKCDTVGGDNWDKFISTADAKKVKTEPCA